MTKQQQENLSKGVRFTEKTAREMGKRGNKKSTESRRKAKTLKEYGEILMSLPISDEVFKKQLSEDGIATEDMTNGMAMMVAMMQKALQGDTQAFNSFRDSSGQKPTDKLDANVNQDLNINVNWDD